MTSVRPPKQRPAAGCRPFDAAQDRPDLTLRISKAALMPAHLGSAGCGKGRHGSDSRDVGPVGLRSQAGRPCAVSSLKHGGCGLAK